MSTPGRCLMRLCPADDTLNIVCRLSEDWPPVLWSLTGRAGWFLTFLPNIAPHPCETARAGTFPRTQLSDKSEYWLSDGPGHGGQMVRSNDRPLLGPSVLGKKALSIIQGFPAPIKFSRGSAPKGRP
ncbi:hypothetical protein Bbelb_269640 [Branchiostoma belcheri]|nr:hypothetical protein Bbelb_269640 [Branchiostoma belcheri]